MKRSLFALALMLLVSLPALAQDVPGDAPRDLPLPRPLAPNVPGLRDRLAALEARPRTTENALAMGVLRFQNRQHQEALALLEPLASGRSPLSSWAALFAGAARLRLNDPAGALALLASVDPADPVLGDEALLLSAYCQEAQGSPEALSRYRRFLDLAEQPLRAVALWRAGALAGGAGDARAAGEFYRELFTSLPWTVSAEKALPQAQALFRAGRSLFDPDSAEALRQRIETLLDRSQAAKAQPVIDRYAAAPGADPFRAAYLKGKAAYARRDTEKAVQYFEDAARSPDATLAAWALYHQGRALWRFSGPEDARAMEALLTRALEASRSLRDGADLAEASRRLLLLLAVERGRLAEALPLARALADSGPEPTESREQAAWLTGLLRHAQGDQAGALGDFAAFLERFPNSDYAPGAWYWTGRARLEARDPEGARQALRRVLARWPNGYYGMLAARRLAALEAATGVGAPAGAPVAAPLGAGPASGPMSDPASGPASGPDFVAATSPGVAPGSLQAAAPARSSEAPGARPAPLQDAGDPPACPDPAASAPPGAAPFLERAALLEAALLPELAERELGALVQLHPQDPVCVLRYARLAESLGNHAAAVRVVGRAFRSCLARGSREALAPLRELVYPSRHGEQIERNLTGSGVDPDIIRGLIRQESFFDPDAVSGAGAVGLMQLLPSTAKSQAEKYGEKGFKTESLKDPAVNIRFGVRYFLERYREYGGSLPLTLAGYNAGRVKVGVWREFLGGLDQELFVEFIPYTETRDYVKRILGNQAMYGLLYPVAR
ncbi:Soluble lytic murein transglycosylase [Fundidesulfovibrio magnetotacticus]|uniref:Soluble lytic murein transglycosylase n=1 Tax=Fundidesulfovibrio magnetotacticus TaxID=2730080 RepID=A0A6V8LWL6_9BACT|nr:transglycosylase SLT domain-containing protein [Fundidesulfovibrio magnetotacticus]GFK94057.1 Soluble lytic murein transglycosylase [Fundidesulfovibrio magnetotacticus]